MRLIQQTANELFQSTLSVRRATNAIRDINLVNLISIHALREESDDDYGRGTLDLPISIHALREESDRPMTPLAERRPYFNPRSP